MPIKDKSMSIIRLKSSSHHSLQSLFEDIFYRDKTGALAKSALILYNKIKQEPGLRSSEWQNYIANVFKISPLDFAEIEVLKEICKRYDVKADSKKGLRGRKPYHVLVEKHSKGRIKLEEKELELLQHVSRWHSAVSSYYSIINKLKAIGLIEKKEGNYIASNRFVASLRAIEKSLSEK